MSTPTSSPQIVTYRPDFKTAYKDLNVAWIQEFFRVEKKDLEQLDNPEECRIGGGEIFFALVEGRPLGTCAMYRIGPERYELAKMAVDPKCQGLGLGRKLMQASEDWARARGATEILILSNTVLVPAITLYKKFGFQTIRLGPHPDYERCNIEMTKALT